MPEARRWLRQVPDGTVLRVHVGPGASRAGITGFHGDALRVRVRARPLEGAANRELLGVLAGALGVRPADLELEAGSRGREKRVRVRGLAAETVQARLTAALSVDPAIGHT